MNAFANIGTTSKKTLAIIIGAIVLLSSALWVGSYRFFSLGNYYSALLQVTSVAGHLPQSNASLVVGNEKSLPAENEIAAANEIKVLVVAKQFKWQFYYAVDDNQWPEQLPDKTCCKQKVFSSEHLVVPANAEVKLRVTSEDVIHSLAIKGAEFRIDAFPLLINELTFVSDSSASEQEIYCAELCGADHAFHTSIYRVLPEADYQVWFLDNTI